MKTPAGKECRYFYGDYYRGRHHEECRLLLSASPPLSWKPAMCVECPVPGILFANACQDMQLEPFLSRPFPFLKQQVGIRTFCQKNGRRGFDAHIGCGECHPLPDIFGKITDVSDPTA
jgi:hypothetical protein